jgi:hypothetical protein
MLQMKNVVVILLAMVFLSLSSTLFAQETLVVFDGGAKKDGKSWAHPRGISSMKISWQKPFSNDTHLDFKVKFARGWAGAGWNWASWKGAGVNVSEYKNLVFRIGVSDAPLKDIFIQLTSNDGSGADSNGPVVEILPLIEKRKKYVRISISLKELFGDKLDSKNVWGINFSVFGKGASGECRIYIDQIEFTR